MNNVLIDVLVPAYGNPTGVERIVSIFEYESQVNVIVSDDSANLSEIENMQDICFQYGACYIAGPKMGAVYNWNSLLSLVTAPYCVLVHHDEYFSNTAFLKELKEGNLSIDALILPVIVKDANDVSRYVYSWQQRIFVTFFRYFAPMLNIIGGPTALLILKTDHLMKFDSKLIYQVDCEWYAKVLLKIPLKNINFSTHTRVISTYLPSSITNNIRSRLSEIIKADIKIIKHSRWKEMMIIWHYTGMLVTILYKTILAPTFASYYLRSFFRRKK